jgi:hypothetical protein
MTRCAITGREQSQQGSPLFDHLVGAGEQRWRYVQAERLVAHTKSSNLGSTKIMSTWRFI